MNNKNVTVTEVLNTQLPRYFRPVIEFQEILKACGPLLRQIEVEATHMRDNFYIATCDRETIDYYEKLLGINKARGLSLEERRSIVLMKYGMRPLYTLPMLKEMLGDTVGADNYSVISQSEKCQLIIILIEQDMEKVREIYDTVALIRPAHIQLFFKAEYVGECEVPVRYAEAVHFRTGFYPRFNLPRLRLDGSWRLDGSRRLSGYDTQETVNLYPVRMSARFGVKASPETATRIHIPLGSAGEPVKTGTCVSFRGQASAGPESSGHVRMSTGVSHHMSAGTITIRNESYLDGTWRLDGSRKLNGGGETR